jgi:hypothetical protein
MQFRVDRPSGYACRCAQITRFGTASGDRHRALVADQNGGPRAVILTSDRHADPSAV